MRGLVGIRSNEVIRTDGKGACQGDVDTRAVPKAAYSAQVGCPAFEVLGGTARLRKKTYAQ